MREAGHASKVLELLRIGARARAGRPWEAVLAAAADICSTAGVRSVAGHEVLTVKQLGERWASGDLHRKHPDHVKAKKHPKRDAGIARKYVDPVIGRLNVADVTLADCDQVMAELAERHEAEERRRRRKATPLAPATRRQVAQYMHRLLAMAAYPCRLRSANPIPENWLPKVGDTKAKECLYPSEDRALLACRGVPLVRRLAYGFMCREGMRRGELQRLTWADVDLERGRVDLDINKTDEPRAWALSPGVAAALALWKRIAPKPRLRKDAAAAAARVFAIDVDELTRNLHDDLKLAGVTRAKLFERSSQRLALRVHDLRGTFVTNALAMGRTEAWVSDRTGHKSSVMIARYRRRARGWSELELGALDALDRAVPEFLELAAADDEDQPQGEPPTTAADASGAVVQGTAAPCSAGPERARQVTSGEILRDLLSGARCADVGALREHASDLGEMQSNREDASELGASRARAPRDGAPIQNPPG